jgi:hypothetical protein
MPQENGDRSTGGLGFIDIEQLAEPVVDAMPGPYTCVAHTAIVAVRSSISSGPDAHGGGLMLSYWGGRSAANCGYQGLVLIDGVDGQPGIRGDQ